MECLAIPPEGATLEDDGPCITLGGKPENYGEIDGNGGHAFHTALDTPSPDYAEGGIWILTFEQAGTYELEVFIPNALPNPAAQATYKIAYGGQSTKEFVDHAATLGTWASLGVYDFALGDGQWVRLGDNYEIAGDNGKRVAIDALRVTPANACECGEEGAIDALPCGVNGEQTRVCDGCAWGPWSACDDASTTGDATSGGTSDGSAGTDGSGTDGSATASTGDSGGGTGGTDGSSAGGSEGSAGSSGGMTSVGSASATAGASGFDPDNDDAGCSCVASARGSTPPALLVLLALLGVRRRRSSALR
jgi:MYXO-CTERM domain-containing protein